MMIQLIILFLSGLSIWLATSKIKRDKIFGSSIGVVAQVFWLIETYTNNQWGMFILSFWYLIVFLRIILNEGNLTKKRTKDNVR